MSWCPKCKNEYRAGITVCPDCNEELLEELTEEMELEYVPLFQTTEEELKERIVKYLIHCGHKIKEETSSHENDEEITTVYFLFVPEADYREALMEVKTVLAYDPEKEETEQAPKPKKRGPVVSNLYVDAGERCKEYKSSGIMFLVFAALLFIFGVLNVAGMISVMASTVSLVLIFGAVILFLVVGISSLAKVSSLREEAATEEKTTDTIKDYLSLNFSKEYFESQEDDTSGELLYFQRVEEMKEAVMEQFPDAAEDYIDALLEDYYNSLNL